MHPSHASLCSKLLSIFFAAALTVGLMPSAAFAAQNGLQSIPEGSEGAAPIASSAEGGGDDVFSHCPSDDASSADGGSAATSSESVPNNDDYAISTEGPEDPSGEISSPGDGDGVALPAGAMINQEVALDTVAQAESTRSFFLAQTLESTKTVPVVSAKLPIDKGAADHAGQGSTTTEPNPDGEGSGGSEPIAPSVTPESTVIGSFEYRGITYAVEPGGESVAIVAADYAKLPTDFIEAQTIVLPSVVSPDGVDYYSVTRVADGAFASLTAAAAAAAENGQDAGASSDIQAQAEACAYGKKATPDDSEGGEEFQQVISGVVSLSDDPSQHVISSDTAEAPNPHVISSEGDEVPEVEKSRPSGKNGSEASANSTDGKTAGITAITIPASITTIEDDAFSGFDTLQYVIVSDDNPNYSMYDGCLYDKPLSSLLLIPEGRLGAVRIAPSVTSIDPEVFSHCPSVDTLVADADSAAYQLLQGDDWHNALFDSGRSIDDGQGDTVKDHTCEITTLDSLELRVGESTNIHEIAADYLSDDDVAIYAASNDSVEIRPDGYVEGCKAGIASIFIRTDGESGKLLLLAVDIEVVAGSSNVAISGERASYGYVAVSMTIYLSPAVKKWSIGETAVGDGGLTGMNTYPWAFYLDKSTSGSWGSYDATTGQLSFSVGNGSICNTNNGLLQWWNNGAARWYTLFWDRSPTPYRLYDDADYTKVSDEFNYWNTPGSYAGYVRAPGVSVVWDITKYGGANAQVRVAGSASFARGVNGKQDVCYGDAGATTLKTALPEVMAPYESCTFLGWTRDGQPSLDGSYQKEKEEVSFSGNEINTTVTYYAVWTTKARFSAPSYGGKIIDNTDGITDEVTIFNNQPVPVEMIPAVGTDESGSFVPNQHGEEGYDADKWRFMGWTAKANPNVSESGGVGGSTDHLAASDLMSALIPDGSTTFHAVWECKVSWEKAAGSPEGTAFADTSGTASYLYGYNITTPAITASPASYHFDRWVASDGTESVEVTDAHGDVTGHTIVVKVPDIVAHWVPNERDVVLSSNGGSTADQTVWSEYGKAMSLYTSTGSSDSGVELAVPTREGYEFAGYWNTRYTEAEGVEEEVPTTKPKGDGSGEHKTITVTAKRYYGMADGKLTSAADWDITNDAQQLFAHWKYKIRFDKNVGEDKAQLNLDYADPESYRVNVAVGLAVEGEATDRYGNAFNVVSEGTDDRATETIEVTAIAGAPVQLYAVHSRQQMLDGRWQAAGYNPTIAFTTVRDDAASAVCTTKVDGAVYTSAWEGGPAVSLLTAFCEGTSADEVQKVDGVYAITLHADWTDAPQRFWVKVIADPMLDYEGLDDAGASVRERYDYDADLGLDDEYRLVTFDGAVDDLAPDPFGVRASAAVSPIADDGTVGEPVTHENLELQGFYSEPNSLYDAQVAGRKHLNAHGEKDGTCEPRFREYKLTALYVESRDGADATRPSGVEDEKLIPLFARWAEPTTAVVFNYYDDRTVAASTKSSDEGLASAQAFDLQKGDVLADKASEFATQLAQVASTVRTVANRDRGDGSTRFSCYGFNGFWTDPFRETGDGVKQYFKMEGDSLVPAREKWEEDVETPLYAHWKFTIDYRANPIDPLAGTGVAAAAWQGGSDMLWFASAGTPADSAQTIPYGNGEQVVYGQEVTLVTDPSTIVRTRDYGTAGAKDVRRTGYAFDGWYADEALSDAIDYADGAAAVDTTTLRPVGSSAGLFAKWEQESYALTLREDTAGMFYHDDAYLLSLQNRDAFEATRTVRVRFDEPIRFGGSGDTGKVVPPTMAGFDFLGFYTTEQKAAPSIVGGTYDYASDDPARQKLYGSAVVGGLVQPEGARWTTYLEGDLNAEGLKTGSLFAHYSLIERSVTFDPERDLVREPFDSDQKVDTASGYKRQAQVYYGKKLDESTFPSTETFSRHGYRFAGWYYLPDGDGPFTETDRTYIYRCDGAVPTIDARWLLDRDGVVLHGAWTPITYTVNFYFDLPTSEGASSSPEFTSQITYGHDVRLSSGPADRTDRIPEASDAPFAFQGWRTDSAHGSRWLVNGGTASQDEGDFIKASGVFMPEAVAVSGADTDQPWIDYHARWHPLKDEHLVLFPGNHGKLTAGFDEKGDPVTPGSDASVVANDIGLTFGETYDLDDQASHVIADGGWEHLGWVEVSADEFGDAHDLCAAGTSAQALLKGGHGDAVAAVNGVERTDPSNKDYLAHDALFKADAEHYRTHYLVALYGQEGPYKLELDRADDAAAGESATIGAWAGGDYDASSYSFATQTYDSGTGRYEDTPRIQLPEATRTGYTFEGWALYEVDAAGNHVLGDDGEPKVRELIPADGLADGANLVDPYDVAEDASGHRSNVRTYHAVWTPNTYTVVLHLNRADNGNESVEVARFENVAYNDPSPLRLPYPAVKGGGMFFMHYDARPLGGSSMGDRLYAYDEDESVAFARSTYTMKQILQRCRTAPADATVHLYAQWGSSVSVQVPVKVLIKVDPDQGDMITSPMGITSGGNGFPDAPTSVSTTAAGQMTTDNGTRQVEVVSLRYEKGRDGDAFAVQDADAATGAKAFLTVYAGQTDLDFRRGGNVDATTGEVTSGPSSGYSPLPIDLSDDERIYPDPSTTGKLSGTYGFAPISGAHTTLPLYYGLLFQGKTAAGDDLSAAYFRDVTGTLAAIDHDTDDALEFAKVTYTIRQIG